MKSPLSDKDLILEFNEGKVFYRCPDTNEEFTDTVTDEISLFIHQIQKENEQLKSVIKSLKLKQFYNGVSVVVKDNLTKETLDIIDRVNNELNRQLWKNQ